MKNPHPLLPHKKSLTLHSGSKFNGHSITTTYSPTDLALLSESGLNGCESGRKARLSIQQLPLKGTLDNKEFEEFTDILAAIRNEGNGHG